MSDPRERNQVIHIFIVISSVFVWIACVMKEFLACLNRGHGHHNADTYLKVSGIPDEDSIFPVCY